MPHAPAIQVPERMPIVNDAPVFVAPVPGEDALCVEHRRKLGDESLGRLFDERVRLMVGEEHDLPAFVLAEQLASHSFCLPWSWWSV